jgi:hypothetical protein
MGCGGGREREERSSSRVRHHGKSVENGEKAASSWAEDVRDWSMWIGKKGAIGIGEEKSGPGRHHRFDHTDLTLLLRLDPTL